MDYVQFLTTKTEDQINWIPHTLVYGIAACSTYNIPIVLSNNIHIDRYLEEGNRIALVANYGVSGSYKFASECQDLIESGLPIIAFNLNGSETAFDCNKDIPQWLHHIIRLDHFTALLVGLKEYKGVLSNETLEYKMPPTDRPNYRYFIDLQFKYLDPVIKNAGLIPVKDYKSWASNEKIPFDRILETDEIRAFIPPISAELLSPSIDQIVREIVQEKEGHSFESLQR